MQNRSTDEALARLLGAGRARAEFVGPEQVALWDSLRSATEGGRRFRPYLLMSTHDALGGHQEAAAAEVGAALELLHTAFVIHDDLIDGDVMRRGRLNVNGTFAQTALSLHLNSEDADHYGRTAAILAGDLALATAIRAVAVCGAPAPVVRQLLDLFDVGLHTSAAGELADVRLSLHHARASLQESLAMEEQKTGAYSFSLPLQAGALLAGADEDTVERLGQAGRLVGIAFQLKDDLIGVFGDPEVSGKSATGDLRTNKQTPLIVHARSTPTWADLSRYVGRELDSDELQRARDLLIASGSRRFVEHLVGEYVQDARSLLDEVGLPTHMLVEALAQPDALTGGPGAAA
ncbi:polyprenyl synthetase family protein [Aeromicrobium sp.]|uniref:polyprenyl synthetase family protein n=1 Tax=Aeromicrobium sp. TaxID=1871063 RepID=UPI0025C53EBC|nr:polyprenyl synthetase family protein [Aeromicrobium sp.]MCK5891799.1 polyprenyl synthetase family protein [Aeromicrobium sp.]